MIKSKIRLSYEAKYGQAKTDEYFSRRGKLGAKASSLAKWKKKNNVPK